MKDYITGHGRQTNPTPSVNGNRVELMLDDLGRVVFVPFNVRDLHQTAAVTLTTGTSSALLTGSAGVFLDLVHVTMANTSDGAVNVELYQDGTRMEACSIPARDTKVISYSTPIPQGTAGATWNADMEDVTGTTVYVDALFVKNV